jgi:alkanesulfonate monooxygenase SsuD/methylene tetrahydromethanopterin reductase-like flavin-dependent oxidoreductase (luciferase family)
MPPRYNHPARVAERIAALDLVSRGRVDWGTGESATALEMEGFGINPDEKNAMWQEATEQAANMLVMRPYPGYQGRYFEMPCRNLVPKAVQKPHPPMWVACSRRETIHRAARHGLGALTFAFVEPEQAAHWVAEYYAIIKSPECVPLGHAVNANVAIVSGMSCHPDEQEAIRRGLDGFRFFGYSLGYVGIYGRHRPGVSDVWAKFLEVKDSLKDNAGRGGIGTPEQVAAHLRRYEAVGIDQVIFVQQSGRNRHRDICESLEIFGKHVLPEFQERDCQREVTKQRELANAIDAALARKPRMQPIAPEDVPEVVAFGQRAKLASVTAESVSDRGGGIAIPRDDPHAARQRAS